LKFDNYDYLIYIFVFTLILDRTGLMCASLEQKRNLGLEYNIYFMLNIVSLMILVILIIRLYKKVNIFNKSIPE